MASGVSQAIKAVDNIIAYWQGIADLSLGNLLDSAGGGGGGGSGESLTAVTGELQEWYNLTRQIENLEQKINNLIAERENIRGGAALRNLRTQQALLEKQAATQSTLLKYQQMQLERQKEHILNNDIWGKFLTFDSDGNLQYINGNEANGGKGALDVLQNFHKMSGEEQQAYLAKIGYSYTDQDGKTYEGTELAEKFEEEFQAQIDQYQSLYDTVNETEATLENIKSDINKIEEEIRENQMQLEQDIYDILVEAWEEQIDHMEEQKDLIEDANKAYIDGLNNALSAEQNMYQDNQSIEEREQLQRRLALLRRSGGSASEIYDLEQQLDNMLKDEYFNKQEEMIENIEKANDEQVKKLEQQIKLQEEALEYQKENGVLWTKVYEIMAGTTEDILAFMQGNSVDFFEQSALAQEQALEEWWNSIDMFTADREYLNHKEAFQSSNWDTGKVWESSELSGLKSIFDGLGDEEKDLLKATYLDAYASSRANGGTEEEAAKSAIDSLKNQLEARKNQQNNEGNEAPTTQPGTSSSSSSSEGAANGKKYRVEYRYFMYKSQEDKKNNSSDRKKVTGSGVGTTAKQAQQNATYWVNKGNSTKQAAINAGYTVLGNLKYYEAKQFLKGGLVDYTGPAIVHGSKSKPEAFLNAKQTAMISDAVKIAGDGGALDGIKAVLNKLDTSIKNLVANNTKEINNFTVAPGAVTIQVAQLNDSYDVEELSKDIMNRMVSIASKTTNRGVNRR